MSYKVLIIEDEALVARELKARLTNMGYDVCGVAYGRDGIELAREVIPDILLTDIHLKDGEDGIAVAEEIQRHLNLPVVFLTAYSDEETVSRAKSVTPYGYIIKPVENRELQIVLEMALYKHNIEQELKQTRDLLQTALQCIGNSVVFVDRDGQVVDMNDDARELLDAEGEGRPWYELFGIDPASSIGEKISRAQADAQITKLAPFIVQTSGGSRLVDGIVGPREAGAVLIIRELSDLRDPLEPIPRPDEERLTPSESSLCLMMVGVDGNDHAVSQAQMLLHQRLRSTDLVSPHGRRELAVSMPYTQLAEGRPIADSILAALKEQDSEVVFSVGLASAMPNEQQPFELFRRAARALELSRDTGGGRVVVFNDDGESVDSIPALSSDRERAYHNVVLLWNVMNLVVNTRDRQTLSERVSEHVLNSFGFECVAVLEQRGDAVMSIGGVQGPEANLIDSVADLHLNERDFVAINELMASENGNVQIDDRCIFRAGSSLLVFIVSSWAPDPEQREFLQTLLNYAAPGLVASSNGGERDQRVDERQIIYRSPRMKSILDSVELVAPTEATVLIVGESGTGKESIARRIHELSPRASKPFTIVDCGAVVSSLVESELFGHVRGAFTGADRDFPGRLKEADGGTVLLDEVGELPLDVQVKLLRFVQDQQFVPVGGRGYERVDTRIVAATNRDLEAAVREGSFREDLFYRLNVFAINVPPLRDREGDLVLLARHFLARYAAQYGKQIVGFTAEAEAALLEQPWLGNIRELMNIVNRAVILCRDDRISNIHLGLFPNPDTAAEVSEGKVERLGRWVNEWVGRALELPQPPPLAQWLEEDLIEMTMVEQGDVLNRAARQLQVPESTLRRRVARLRESQRDAERSPAAETVGRAMSDLFALAAEEGHSALTVVETLILRNLEQRHVSRQTAAEVMGVSLPTYRKLVSETP